MARKGYAPCSVFPQVEREVQLWGISSLRVHMRDHDHVPARAPNLVTAYHAVQ
jgi:hypothetical protein